VDGNVTDITLHSVVVRNWDMSVSTIPVYNLVSDSFRNWRGLADAGGRRIKRSLYIDMQSIHFLTQPEIDKLSKMPLLSDYMRGKLSEIEQSNLEKNVPQDDYSAGRHLTNLGTFRAYTAFYLRSLNIVAPNMPFVVRQLQPEAVGIPIELYFFCSFKAWENYECIQADIFDHLLAIVKDFGLRIYQSPSGADLHALADNFRPPKT
jgi:miniconductance mechanosensitive channel